jgi:hypothetical protein
MQANATWSRDKSDNNIKCYLTLQYSVNKIVAAQSASPQLPYLYMVKFLC